MERFPVELLYLLVFLGIILFNYMMQQAAGRRRQEEGAQAAAQAKPPAAEDQPLEHVWGRRPQRDLPAAVAHVEAAHGVGVIAAAPAVAPRRAAPRALFRSKRDLRHAMVVMTVLGPCRALEPDDRRQAGTAAGGATPGPS